MQSGPMAGLILAGGRSRRMGGRDKALEVLAGRTLLRRVLDRLAPQVDEVALSVEQPSTAFAAFGVPQLAQLTEPRGTKASCERRRRPRVRLIRCLGSMAVYLK